MQARKAAKLIRQRERNGQYQRPTTRAERRAEGIMAVALAHPHRKGRHTQLAGFTVGRMFLDGHLGPDPLGKQRLNASERFTRIAVAYMRDVTGTLPKASSMMAERVASETGDGKPQDPERIAQMRAEWQQTMTALADRGLFTNQGVLAKACVFDKDLHPLEYPAFLAALDCLRAKWKEGG